MAILAPVQDDGTIITDLSTSSSKEETSKSGNTLGKDDFLQLLVAQMKYQDPLEPTSNTEYISQYATFSELEQMQNMSASMDLNRASNLVGQHVYMKTTNTATGNTSFIYGKVDYVQMENNKAFLSINGKLYSIDDLDSVVDESYMDAYNKAQNLVNEIRKLPTVANVTMTDKEAIDAINKTYSDMSDYEKSFFDTTIKELIQSYVDKLAEVEAVAKETAESMVKNLDAALAELPKIEELTLENEEAVEAAEKLYMDMNAYQRGYVSEETKTLLDSYTARIEELKKQGEA